MRPLEAGDPTSVGQGRYRLTGRLGQGGMGVVYFGRSPSGRAVAVKVVRPELSTEPGFLRRFADEVAAARRVGGFHTAPVVDADPDGEPAWLVTAFVPGPTLQAVLLAVGALPAATVSVLAAGLAEALEAIHRAGVVHRDLKPANIIAAEDGPRVIDFGIARALDGTALTRTGLQIGTPGYLAPEQLTGGAVTPAVDMFALGVVLSQSSGAFPFGDGPSAARHYRVVHEEPDLAGVPPELRPLIGACLAKDPAARPTPSDFLAGLTIHHLAEGAWPPAGAVARREADTPAHAAGAHGSAFPAAESDPGAGPARDGAAAEPALAQDGPPAPGPVSEATAPAAPAHPDTVRAAYPPDGWAAGPPPARPDEQETPPPPAGGGAAPYAATVASAPGAAGTGPGAGGAGAGAFGPPGEPYGPASAEPSRPAPGGPGSPGGNGPRRSLWRPLVTAAAVLAVAGTTALLVTHPWSGGPARAGGSGASSPATSVPATTAAAPPPSSPSATGPAALPTDPILVRENFPRTADDCGQVIGVRAPGSDVLHRLTNGKDCDRLPQWSPDRGSFAFVRGDAKHLAVWVANADGSGARELAAISSGRVSWSPDGTRMAVLRKAPNGVQQLFVLDVSDGSARQITSATLLVDDPAWSPDGTRIAVCIETKPGLSQVNLVDPDRPGAVPRQITVGARQAKDPAWSPDGTTFAYTYAGVDTQADIHLIGTDGNGDHVLAATADREMDPTWSPDGTWVAYVRGPLDAPALWAVRADGTGARKLTTGDIPEGHPSWR